MRNRIKRHSLAISVTADGFIKKNLVELPKYKATEQDLMRRYSKVKPKHREYSKSIANKVAAFRATFKALEDKNRELEVLVRKNSARVISDSLNRVIINSR